MSTKQLWVQGAVQASGITVLQAPQDYFCGAYTCAYCVGDLTSDEALGRM